MEGISTWVVQEMRDGGEGAWEPLGWAQIREDGDVWKELKTWVGVGIRGVRSCGGQY